MSHEPDFFDAVYKYINHIVIHEQNGLKCKLGIVGEDSTILGKDDAILQTKVSTFMEKSSSGNPLPSNTYEKNQYCCPDLNSTPELENVYLFGVDITRTSNQEQEFGTSNFGGSCSRSEDGSKASPRDQISRERKQDREKKVHVLRSLLSQCVEEVNDGKLVDAQTTLKIIRERSSMLRDDKDRLAHYISNAIEARIARSLTKFCAAPCERRASLILNAYQAYIMVVPFLRMSNIFANKAIYKKTTAAKRIHVVDFGISYGWQWPSFIQSLSLRPDGPPKLRLTGIDSPQMVEKTGYHLAEYCKRFNVPFEYNGISKKWDSIQLEDIKIDKDETIVVNCLYRLRHISNELVLNKWGISPSPRDIVLDLIKRINPEIFVHGILNGDHSSESLPERFDRAWSYFSYCFNMLQATLMHDEESRMILEQEMLEKQVMNVMACEGSARIERPQRYGRWVLEFKKFGFEQLEVDKEIVKEVKAKTLQYHRNFMVYEYKKWMLQGWNERVLYALSLWKPVKD